MRLAIRFFLVMTLLTGVAYPLVVLGIAQTFFPHRAGGSLVQTSAGQIVGSEWIGVSFTSARYFHGRPSACGYATTPSAASNLAPSSRRLSKEVEQRRRLFSETNYVLFEVTLPAEMLYASASGLDPHISPEAARMQMARVVRERGLSAEATRRLDDLVTRHTRSPQWGFLGRPTVNVLLLNLALDELGR